MAEWARGVQSGCLSYVYASSSNHSPQVSWRTPRQTSSRSLALVNHQSQPCSRHRPLYRAGCHFCAPPAFSRACPARCLQPTRSSMTTLRPTPRSTLPATVPTCRPTCLRLRQWPVLPRRTSHKPPPSPSRAALPVHDGTLSQLSRPSNSPS
jgi:hypothetical protein